MLVEKIDFERQVIEASKLRPVLVDFWAPWCGPCRVIGPILEKISQEPGVSWQLVKINIDENPDVAQSFQVMSIPAVKLFYRGRVAAEFVGALPENQVRGWLHEYMPSEEKDLLEEAFSLAESGRREMAVKTLEELLARRPTEEAKALLARLTVFDNPDRARELVQAVEQGDPAFDDAEVVRQLADLTSMTTKDLPDDPARQPLMHAMTALKARDWSTVLDALIRSMALNRAYLDDLARKSCVSIFKYLGDNHPVTEEYRPRFSMALYG